MIEAALLLAAATLLAACRVGARHPNYHALCGAGVYYMKDGSWSRNP